eukprot:6474889-Amphidinium_carterae.1
MAIRREDLVPFIPIEKLAEVGELMKWLLAKTLVCGRACVCMQERVRKCGARIDSWTPWQVIREAPMTATVLLKYMTKCPEVSTVPHPKQCLHTCVDESKLNTRRALCLSVAEQVASNASPLKLRAPDNLPEVQPVSPFMTLVGCLDMTAKVSYKAHKLLRFTYGPSL